MSERKVPETNSAVNFMTSEELNQAEERVFAEFEMDSEEDLTIYHEEELMNTDKEELPEGSLMREANDGMIYVKILDIWTP